MTCPLLATREMNNQYTVTARNKIDSLQKTPERLTRDDEYENISTTYIEAAVKCIPKVSSNYKKKTRDHMKKSILIYNRKPVNGSAMKLRKNKLNISKVNQ